MKKIIYIILVILFYSCSDDDLLNEQISSAQPASTIIPITKAKYSYDTQKNNLFIQQKAPKFYQRFSPKSADASSITLSWGTIKTDEALEVQEVNGYTTTTYKIEPYEKQDDELYNLVFISKDTLVSAHVYGYKMDETFKTNYHENGESLANFSGQIVSQEIIMEEDRISNIDCVEFINDLLNDQNGGNTGGGSSGSGTSPGGSPSNGGSTAGATDWFDSVPVFEDEAPSTSDPIDWSWVGNVGGAIVDAGGAIGSFFGDIWGRIKDLFSGCGCGVNGRPAPSSSKSIVDNDYKEVVYVVIDLDEEHDCYPLAIGIIGDTLSPEYIEDLFGMSMEDFENVRDNHPQLFIDMIDVVMQGDFNANRISLFRNLSLALLDDSVSEENIANILLFLSENNTDEGIEFISELVSLASLEPTEDANKIMTLTLLVDDSGNELFTDQFATSLFDYIDIDLSTLPPGYPPNLLTLKVYLNYVKLKQLNPEWSRGKCIWYATKEIIHISLDVFGLIPVVGEAADLVNGVLYVIEGDTLNATLSFGAAIPFVGYGSTATKYGLKIINAVNDVNTKVKLVWKVTANGIDFGSRSKLRKVLGLTDSNFQAHHIIPWGKRDHPAIQKAAKSDNSFHMNEALNGKGLHTDFHNGSHSNYDNLIQQRLDNIDLNQSDNDVYNDVFDIINDVLTSLQNNPNTHINQLVF